MATSVKDFLKKNPYYIGYSNTANRSAPAPPPKQRGLLEQAISGITQPFRYFGNAAIVNPTKEIAAQLSGNKTALRNAQRKSSRDLGLGKENDLGRALTMLTGNTAQLGLTFAPPARAATLGGRVAAGAKIGAGFGGASSLGRGESVDEALKSALVGGALGGAIGTFSRGARAPRTASTNLGRGGTIAKTSTLGSASEQNAVMSLSRKYPEFLKGSGTAKFRNVEKLSTKLVDDVDELFRGVKTKGMPLTQFTNRVKSVIDDISDPLEKKAFSRLYNKAVTVAFKGKQPARMGPFEVNAVRRQINKQAGAVMRKQKIGSPLTATDNAVLNLRDNLDDVITNMAPKGIKSQVNVLNKDISTAIKSIPEFKRLSEQSLTFPAIGKIPGVSGPLSRAGQSISDTLGRATTSTPKVPRLPQTSLMGGRPVTAAIAARTPNPPLPPEPEDTTLYGALARQSGGGQAETPFQTAYSLEQALADIQANPDAKSRKNIMDYYEFVQDAEAARGNASGGALTADQKNKAAKAQALTQGIGVLLQNFQNAGGGQGAGGIPSSLAGRTPGIRSLGIAPRAQQFEDQRKALIAPLARAISGEVGVLTDRDISRAEGLLPRLSDPPQVANKKIEDLLFLIQSGGGATTQEQQFGDLESALLRQGGY